MSKILKNIDFDERITITTNREDINIDTTDVKYNSIWYKYNTVEKLLKIKLSLSYDYETCIKKDLFNENIIYLSVSKIKNITYLSEHHMLNIFEKEINIYKSNKCVETINRGPYCCYQTLNKDRTILHSH